MAQCGSRSARPATTAVASVKLFMCFTVPYDPGVYKAILLDVFGTLVVDDDAPYILPEGVSPAEFDREWNARLWAMADGAHGPAFRTLADLNASSLAETAGHFGIRVPARPFGPPVLFDDAAPFLAALDVPVCLVSDADRAPLTDI